METINENINLVTEDKLNNEVKNKEYHFLESKVERIVFLVLLLIICISPILFGKGMPTHADWHIHMERAYNFKRCFWQGQFIPRWIDAQNFGYGLPVFNYYAPLPYYVFVAIDLILRNILVSMKWIYILPVILTTLFGYLYLRKHCSAVAVCCAMPFIIFSPAVHIYVYNCNWPGSISAIPFVFLALLGIDSFDKNKDFDLKSFLVVSLSYGLMCLAHIATAFIFTLAMIPYFFLSLYVYRTKKFIKNIFLSFIMGGSLASFYLLPAIFEKNFVHADEVLTRGPLWDYSKNFLYTFLDRESNKGYAWAMFDHRYYEVSNAILGLAVFVCFVVLVVNMDRIKKYYKEPFRINIVLTMFVLTFLMMTPVSIFVWLMIKPLHTIQFPWRFTSLVLPFAAVIIAYTFDFSIKLAQEKLKLSGLRFISFIMTCLLLILMYVDFINMYRWEWVSPHTLLKAATTVLWANDEYRPKFNGDSNWMQIDFGRDFSPSIDSTNFNVDIKLLQWLSHLRVFEVFSEVPHSLHIRTFYFPGWKAYVDGRESGINIDTRSGTILIPVPAGKHEIKVAFENTPIRKNSLYISFAALLIYLYFLINLFEKKKKKTFDVTNIQKQNVSEGVIIT